MGIANVLTQLLRKGACARLFPSPAGVNLTPKYLLPWLAVVRAKYTTFHVILMNAIHCVGHVPVIRSSFILLFMVAR